MGKSNKTGKSKKLGRDKVKAKVYVSRDTRALNKLRKQSKHCSAHPNDEQAARNADTESRWK